MHNIIFCVFLVVIGGVFVAFPKEIYDCIERWKNIGDTGPSKKYITFTRLYGAMLIVTGIVVPVILVI